MLFRLMISALSVLCHRCNVLLLQLSAASLKRLLVLGSDIRPVVPVRCDGSGKVIIGSGVLLGCKPAPRMGNGEILLQAREPKAVVEIGNRVAFSNNVSIIASDRVFIGDDSLIGDSVLIMDSDFHGIDPLQRRTSKGLSSPVIIGKNVWLGSRVIIQKGVCIGENSIIASQAVVTRSIPPNCVAGGNPAKVIRYINEGKS